MALIFILFIIVIVKICFYLNITKEEPKKINNEIKEIIKPNKTSSISNLINQSSQCDIPSSWIYSTTPKKNEYNHIKSKAVIKNPENHTLLKEEHPDYWSNEETSKRVIRHLKNIDKNPVGLNYITTNNTTTTSSYKTIKENKRCEILSEKVNINLRTEDCTLNKINKNYNPNNNSGHWNNEETSKRIKAHIRKRESTKKVENARSSDYVNNNQEGYIKKYSSKPKKYDPEKDWGPYKGTDGKYCNQYKKEIEYKSAYFEAANSDKYGYNKEKDKFKDWKKWDTSIKDVSSSKHKPIYHKKGEEYYTPSGEKIRNIGAYYSAVKNNKNGYGSN